MFFTEAINLAFDMGREAIFHLTLVDPLVIFLGQKTQVVN